ncbi:MAG: hypothetical protein AB1743_01295 [Actinomycetota bacterium]
MRKILLFKILRDAYKLFDRCWPSVLAAAMLSIGLVNIITLIIRLTFPLSTILVLTTETGLLRLTYNDLIEIIAFFMVNVWFNGFLALVALSDHKNESINFIRTVTRSTVLYPKLLLVNVAAMIMIYLSLIAASPVLSLGMLGTLMVIPAIVFAVWFSLVSPVAAIDDIKGVGRILARSRLLVYGNFWTMLAVIAIAFIPPLMIAGIRTNTIFFWPIIIFVNIASSIIGSTLTASAYINLRLAKGEKIIDSEQKIADEPLGP